MDIVNIFKHSPYEDFEMSPVVAEHRAACSLHPQGLDLRRPAEFYFG